ncbi:MAG: hypothetical protein HPY74_09810 [Firmicutes bacterium]|nr:hypothetical protein [Bacillota bacterium]
MIAILMTVLKIILFIFVLLAVVFIGRTVYRFITVISASKKGKIFTIEGREICFSLLEAGKIQYNSCMKIAKQGKCPCSQYVELEKLKNSIQSCDDSLDEEESLEDEECSWGLTDEQDERIRKVVGNIADRDYLKGFKAWDEYLKKALKMPFSAEVLEYQERYYFPLCDLEASDKKSKNYELLNDYSVWFANR